MLMDRAVGYLAYEHVKNGVDRHPTTLSLMKVSVLQSARRLNNGFTHVSRELKALQTRGDYPVSVVTHFDILDLPRQYSDSTCNDRFPLIPSLIVDKGDHWAASWVLLY